MAFKDDPIIPWMQQSSTAKGLWYATAVWRHWSSSAWSRWRWLARVKAIRRVIVFRLFHHFLDTDELIPRWYMFLEGGW